LVTNRGGGKRSWVRVGYEYSIFHERKKEKSNVHLCGNSKISTAYLAKSIKFIAANYGILTQEVINQ